MESTTSNWHEKRIGGRYQITQLLGQRHRSTVWLANDTQNQQKVAIRLLPAVPASHRAYLDDVAARVRAIAALEHPHILAVQEFGEQETDDGKLAPFLVMPYVPGETLAGRMQALKGMLPIYESLRYLRQAARALDYAHHKQALHHNVRPENMFLRKGWLQLADFGIAVLPSSPQEERARSETRAPEYMAPEVILGKEEAASDRYSLAVIAYQLFTGHFPFQGKTSSETLSRQIKEQPPEPRQFNTYIPLEVVQILMRGLAKRPENRPATCAEFLDALEFGWKASGKSDEGPDTTWLAPWSKHWSDNEDEISSGESGELPVQSITPPGQPVPLVPTEQGFKNNLTPFPQPPAGFGERTPTARAGRGTKDNLTPFPQPPAGFGVQAPTLDEPDVQSDEFPELPTWLPASFRRTAISKPVARPAQSAVAVGNEQVGDFPELPAWLPAPFRRTLAGKHATPALSSATVSDDQAAGFPELPSWLPGAFKGKAPGTRENLTPQPQHAAAVHSTPAAGFPELPSWLPRSFRETPNDQSAQILLENRSKSSMTQPPHSPLPPAFQQPSFEQQEPPAQLPDNVIQKPLSFDSVVRNVMAVQASGEIPFEASEQPSDTKDSPTNQARHYESFSGVVREAIAARQQTPLAISLQEPLESRDNSAKFEAVVKQAMGVEQPLPATPTALPSTPASPAVPQESTSARLARLLSQWQKRLQSWLQRTFAWSKQQVQQAYAWSRPRLLRAYAQSRQWLLTLYAWILQLVSKFGKRDKGDNSTQP